LITLVNGKRKVNLPGQLLNSLKNIAGFDEKKFVDLHNSEEKITSVRLNPFKKIKLDFNLDQPVQWCEDGFYLNERPSFTFDPLFHAGCYYVQEAGSMFLEYALKNSVDLSQQLAVLDLCAAPGGKSTLINSLISEESFLISNEVIKPRAEILAHNLNKWGTCNAAVTNCDPQVFSKLPEIFDVIVADVPCSGSGLFRKQPDAVNEWSLDNVNLCSTRQKRIVGDCISSLKSGGIFVYSTCSYSKEENEMEVEWMMKEFDLELMNIPVEEKWNIVDTGLGFRFYPYLTKSEGFFCCVLRKKGNSEENHGRKNKKFVFDEITKKEFEPLKDKIDLKPFHKIFRFQNEFKLVNASLFEFMNTYGTNVYFKKTGTTLGELKHQDFLPHHEFAQSIYLNSSINRIELTKEQAVTFLKKENLILKAEKGISLMTYKNQGIGWAKVLDNRINNYLPKEFRILSQEEF
jgi:16S rRNA C967 or C1407 C5-methylase (RsmB/RsmF family)/NOL1/NOP2/fmu family ribosome biogenesis protein